MDKFKEVIGNNRLWGYIIGVGGIIALACLVEDMVVVVALSGSVISMYHSLVGKEPGKPDKPSDPVN